MAIEWLSGNRLRGTTAERPNLGLPSGSVGGWVELGRTTLGSAGDAIDVTGLADKRYLMALINVPTTGNARPRTRFNADTGSNYSDRWSQNGGGDNTGPSQSFIYNEVTSTTDDTFAVCYASNLSNKEKLTICHGVSAKAAGAGQEPFRSEVVGKWANTSNAISQWNITNDLAGDYTSGAECVVLGWDPDDTHTTNFWEEIGSATGTSIEDITLNSDKKYLWIQAWVKSTGGTLGTMLRVGDTAIDSGTSYAQRRQSDGGSDFADTNTTGLNVEPATSASGLANFINCFVINNASNEKLFISHGIYGNTAGAGNAPNRRELAGKWANTSNQIGHVGIVDTSGTGSIDSTSVVKVWGAD